MDKYLVRFFVPTVYELEAENEEQATPKAVELYQKEQDTWIEPEVQVEKKM